LEIDEDDGYSFDVLKTRLEVPNPEYTSAVRMGFSTAGMRRFDPLYEEGHRGGTKLLRVPRGWSTSTGVGRDVIDERLEGAPADFRFKMQLGPTEEREEDQVDFVEAVVRAAERNTGAIGQASPGYGKALSMDARLWTEAGPICMRDVKVGDRVYGRDGRLHNCNRCIPAGAGRQLSVSRSQTGLSGLLHGALVDSAEHEG
jgi:hypothetical protein